MGGESDGRKWWKEVVVGESGGRRAWWWKEVMVGESGGRRAWWWKEVVVGVTGREMVKEGRGNGRRK